MKKVLLTVANALSILWRILPIKLRHTVIEGLMILETRGQPDNGLRQAFAMEDRLTRIINERALALGAGVHPKHRLMDYHRFFIDHIRPGENVLDVGCSYGAVARSIAQACPHSAVVGMDYDAAKIDTARKAGGPPNLTYVVGDATKHVPDGVWSVVVLSNVLEHIADRTRFLTDLVRAAQPSRLLIRVPYFNRDWSMAMRRELGVYYFSDDDHKIEHTIPEFQAEMAAAGLEIIELSTPWGEIWAVVQSRS